MNILEIKNLEFAYDKDTVIDHLSFTLNESGFFSIVGPNGSGKSSLFKLITKSVKPKSGSIFFQGKNINAIASGEFAKLIASLPQKIDLPFDYKVSDFVMMGRFPHIGRFAAPSANDKEKVNIALELTDTDVFADKSLNELSGGEKQRVYIAQAIAQEPKLLLLDEPTSQLDIGHKIAIMDLLRKLNCESKITIAVILHDLNLAAEYSDKIIMIKNGIKYAEGSAVEVLNYKNIEEVYKTLVLVKENPLTKKPYIFLVAKEQQNYR